METDNARLDCMIDIETLGLKPGSVVASIGAIIFDEDGNHADRFFARLDITDQLDAGLKVDGGTVRWWMKQGDVARADAFDEPTDDTLYAMMTRFERFMNYNRPEGVWAKGPHFDLVLVEALLDHFGFAAPWHYRAPRDVRTLLDLVPDEVGNLPALSGDQHKALDDAAYQVAQVTAARRWLKKATDAARSY